MGPKNGPIRPLGDVGISVFEHESRWLEGGGAQAESRPRSRTGPKIGRSTPEDSPEALRRFGHRIRLGVAIVDQGLPGIDQGTKSRRRRDDHAEGGAATEVRPGDPEGTRRTDWRRCWRSADSERCQERLRAPLSGHGMAVNCPLFRTRVTTLALSMWRNGRGESDGQALHAAPAGVGQPMLGIGDARDPSTLRDGDRRRLGRARVGVRVHCWGSVHPARARSRASGRGGGARTARWGGRIVMTPLLTTEQVLAYLQISRTTLDRRIALSRERGIDIPRYGRPARWDGDRILDWYEATSWPRSNDEAASGACATARSPARAGDTPPARARRAPPSASRPKSSGRTTSAKSGSRRPLGLAARVAASRKPS